jgi:hypothetical protein
LALGEQSTQVVLIRPEMSPSGGFDTSYSRADLYPLNNGFVAKISGAEDLARAIVPAGKMAVRISGSRTLRMLRVAGRAQFLLKSIHVMELKEQ